MLRHNAVRDVLCSAVSKFSSVAPEPEKPSLLHAPPDPGGTTDYDLVSNALSGRRPAHIWVPRGASGCPEARDACISSVLRPSSFASADPLPEDVFTTVEAHKQSFQGTCDQGQSYMCHLPSTCHRGLRGAAGPRPFARSSLGFLANLATSGGLASQQPLHSASHAPFTRKTRVQS